MFFLCFLASGSGSGKQDSFCQRTGFLQGAELAFSYAGEPLRKRVETLVKPLMPDALLVPCDVTQDEDITGCFRAIGATWDTLDFVIHSIAYTHRDDLRRPFINTPRSHFALALDISTYSLVALAREASMMI